ncbi:MAG: hypothetical protein ACRECQ_17845 [Burkholderiaceae bacterium]
MQLCESVEELARKLDRLTAMGRGHTTPAVLLRMRLAAMTAELVTIDLVERLREARPARAKVE